jgi:hypothetical protein
MHRFVYKITNMRNCLFRFKAVLFREMMKPVSFRVSRNTKWNPIFEVLLLQHWTPHIVRWCTLKQYWERNSMLARSGIPGRSRGWPRTNHRNVMTILSLQVVYLWRHVSSTAPPFILLWANLEILFGPLHLRSSPFIGELRCQAIQMEHGPYIAERTQKAVYIVRCLWYQLTRAAPTSSSVLFYWRALAYRVDHEAGRVSTDTGIANIPPSSVLFYFSFIPPKKKK